MGVGPELGSELMGGVIGEGKGSRLMGGVRVEGRGQNLGQSQGKWVQS